MTILFASPHSRTQVPGFLRRLRTSSHPLTTSCLPLSSSPGKTGVEEQETLVKLRQIHPEVDLAYDLVQQFAQMLRTRIGEHLDAWLDQVERSKLPELQSFAAGIEKDKDAVRAGLTWWINNGMVEGHVTKLKLIKRQGYGKAGFPLLRKRVLHAL